MALSTSYIHREYKTDVSIGANDDSWTHLGKRLAVSAVPFLSLYKPFSFPIMVGASALRVYTCMQNNDTLQTTIAVTALAFTIFAFPVGMLITTSHDLFNETIEFGYNVYNAEYALALENLAHAVNSALYAAVLLSGCGSLQLLVASLSLQITLGICHAGKEFYKGNNIEGLAHLGMALIRGIQLSHVMTPPKPVLSLRPVTPPAPTPVPVPMPPTPEPVGYYSTILNGATYMFKVGVTLADGTSWNFSGTYKTVQPGWRVYVFFSEGNWYFKLDNGNVFKVKKGWF